MAVKQVTSDDVRSELESAKAKLDLMDALQKLCPGFKVVLVPLGDDGHGTAAQRGHREPRTIREKVAAATRDWATMEDIIEATGLTKDQVYGVLTAPDAKHDYDRELVPGEPNHGRKHYRMKAEAGTFRVNGGG